MLDLFWWLPGYGHSPATCDGEFRHVQYVACGRDHFDGHSFIGLIGCLTLAEFAFVPSFEADVKLAPS